jgi:phosphinothricin acetyltransferase
MNERTRFGIPQTYPSFPMTMLIRLAEATDGAALADIYRPAVTESATSFELEPPDAAEMARRVTRTLARTPWLVCERDGVVVGYAYASPHRDRAAYQWSVDFATYVHRDVRRLGVAGALYTSLAAALVFQGFRNAYAGITLPNAPSIGLHIGFGFTPICVYRGVGYKNGTWHDVAWYERALAPRDPAPVPPLALRECSDAPPFKAVITTGMAQLTR